MTNKQTKATLLILVAPQTSHRLLIWPGLLFLLLLLLPVLLSAQGTPDYAKAEQLKSQGQFNQANRIYFIALRNDNKDWQALRGLADSYFRMQRWEDARQQLTQLLDVTTDNTVKEEAFIRRAVIASHQQQWQAAINDYQQVIKINSKRSDIWLFMSEAYQKLGNKKKSDWAKVNYEQRLRK